MKPPVIAFVCPACKGPLRRAQHEYDCMACKRTYPIVMDIPDFRLFPDPYISIEGDIRKGEKLAESFDALTFPQFVTRYWEMTPDVPPDLVREFTRNAVAKRDQARSTWQTMQSVGGFQAGGTLLEVGCGTAGFLAAVAGSFDEAVGVDIGFRWLVVAKKRLTELGIDNVSLVCACAEHLPFGDAVFDLVVAEDVLDHTRDQLAFITESRRSLRDQRSMFYLSTPNRYSLGPDPHVWVWGVGFLPPSLRDWYVRRRKGVPYGPISPVSYSRTQRLVHRAALESFRVVLPELSNLDPALRSPWQLRQARVYAILRRVPIVSWLLRLVGPSFQLYCRVAR